MGITGSDKYPNPEKERKEQLIIEKYTIDVLLPRVLIVFYMDTVLYRSCACMHVLINRTKARTFAFLVYAHMSP